MESTLNVDVDVDVHVRNTAGAEILEGDVWGALKIEYAVAEP